MMVPVSPAFAQAEIEYRRERIRESFVAAQARSVRRPRLADWLSRVRPSKVVQSDRAATRRGQERAPKPA